MNALGVLEIKTLLEHLFKEPQRFTEQIKNQKKMIDGQSPKRFKRLFGSLAASDVYFRFATEADTSLYFEWANDEFVRRNSFTQDLIIHENHVKWFNSRLNNSACYLYIFFNKENMPIGQVRIEEKQVENVINISIDKMFRGKGLGAHIVTLACTDYLIKFPLKTIYSYVKRENKASIKIFKKASFSQVNENNSIDLDFLKFIFK
jgi:RimJ/RimL family protein N-acetyltransferase